MDPVEKARSGMGALEHAIASLPGIKGYRNKDMRRDADKQIRESFVHELETRRGRLSSMQQDLLSAGGLLWMDDMERVVGRLQLLIDRVRTAAYGYAGFFDLERIKEPELDRLIEYDRGLLGDLPRLDGALDDLQKAVAANDNIQAGLQGVGAVLADLGDKFGRRADAMRDANA
jgi:hypothetical protein